MTGTSKWWYPNGVLMEEIEYKNGKQEGRYTGYYDNGKVMVSGQLAGGSYDTAKRDGEWTFYDSLGRPKRKEYYDLDSLIKMVTY